MNLSAMMFSTKARKVTCAHVTPIAFSVERSFGASQETFYFLYVCKDESIYSKGTCIGIVCPIFNAVEELPGLDALPHLYQQQLHISVQNRIYMYRKMHQLVHTKFYWTLIMSAITILVCTENVKFHPYPTPAYSPKRFRQTNPPLKFG
ncbi:unnamed protein product [Albugo candida]|uniref:Uncharacterized protein n=1 Tax=Albugo candida TaxID=65357 RepID=A0A024GR95_9STRA|nr:unnamed protein product [Albugo candida]|eukprot:CCI49309.1 unnamed protein product [Albugo candida]